MAGRIKKTEFIFKICLLLFFVFLMWVARDYPAKSKLFPELLGGITILFILISFAQDFLKLKKGEEKVEVKKPEPAPSGDVREETLRRLKEVEEHADDAGYEVLEDSLRKKRLIQSVAIILISLGIGYLGGFLLTVPFYFIAFGILHGQKKPIKYIIIAVVVTVVTYLSFTTLMMVPLLRGLLWDL